MQKDLLVDGTWKSSSESIEVFDPFKGKKIADVASAGREEVETVIAAGNSAASEMRRLSRMEIADGLRRMALGIETRKDEFTQTIIAESAKPLIYARGEVERAIATFSVAAGEAGRFCGEVVPVDTQPAGKGKRAWTRRVPRGLIYGLTPFNFPLNLVAHKVAPALAAGNSIIIKPSPRTPLTALLLGEVFLESGLPKGAFQVVPMDVKYLDAVYDDDCISMISFTGSAPVGWEIKQRAGKKVVALELGGNAPVIVDRTADHDISIDCNITGAFAYSGQVCISVQRIYIHSGIFADWTEQFVKKASEIKVGEPSHESTRLSVMIDEKAAARIEKWVNEAIDNGARALCGGSRNGSTYDATVLTDTDPEMRVVAEEAFAPVVVVEKFDDFRDAVAMANNSKYGLQAGVFSNDLGNVGYAVENMEYGGLIINDVPTFRVDNMPYGGIKDSGFGREGVRYAMEVMSEIRLIVQ
ncbi:MAG: aldehyde dehydrogenase family protein [Acidobacteriota bacterium]